MASAIGNISADTNEKLNVSYGEPEPELFSGNQTRTPDEIMEEVGLAACTIISLVGAIGNLCTLFLITRNKKTRTPTYIVIASMALADFLSLCGFYVYDLGILFAKTTQMTYGYFCYHVGMLGEVFRHASMTQIVLLSGLRYMITVHPLKCKTYLTTKRTLFACIGLWFFSLVFGSAVLTVQLVINGEARIDELGHSINEQYFNMTNLVYYLSVPTIFICIFHILKIRGLKATSMASTSTTSTSDHIVRMTKMTGIVIMAYLITVTPFYAFNLAAYLFDDGFWLFFTLHITNIIYYLNYSINPMIYFFFSPACTDVRKPKIKHPIPDYRKYVTTVSSLSGQKAVEPKPVISPTVT